MLAGMQIAFTARIMKKIIKNLLVAAIGGISMLVAAQSHAEVIEGDINFTGRLYLDTSTTSITDATKVTSFKTFRVESDPSGSFADVGIEELDSVTSSVTTSDAYVLESTGEYTILTIGGFTLTLESSTIELQQLGLLSISGLGTLSGNGYESSPAYWYLSVTGAPSASGANKGSYAFSAGIIAPPPSSAVPDGGTTAILLGITMLGVFVVHRQLSVGKA